MAEQPRRQNPLGAVAAELSAASSDTVRIVSGPFLAQINLRTSDAGLVPLTLPKIPNRVTNDGVWSAIWLGPDEWLLVGPDGAQEKQVETLRSVLKDVHASVIDVSDSRATLEVTGSKAAEALAKGCALDLHESQFKPGQCAQTLLAKAQVILERTGDGFRLYIRSSFARYLVAWLIEAMAEYKT